MSTLVFDYTDYHLHVNIHFLRVMIEANGSQYSFGKLVIRFESFGELMLLPPKKNNDFHKLRWNTVDSKPTHTIL